MAHVFPNFLGIGVQRAATTWLHDQLIQHPDIYLPPQKELHFFNSRLDRGNDWYASHFSNVSSEQAIGEITPLYFHTAPLSTIAQLLPGVRVIVILRQPVERAYSAYQLLYKVYGRDGFRSACESPRGEFLLRCSLYADALDQAIEIFGNDRVKVLLYDNVKSEPEQLIREVFEFLGVDTDFKCSEPDAVTNRIMFPKTQEFLAKLRLQPLVELAKSTPMGDLIKKVSKKRATTSMPRHDRQYCQSLRAYFHSDITKLENLIGLDLSHWK